MDYEAPAEVTWSGGRSRNSRALRRKSFQHLWQAVRFVIGDKTERRGVCRIRSGGDIYTEQAIEALYARPDFPARQLQHAAPSSFLDRMFGAAEPKYRLLGDEDGGWSVICIDTDLPIEVNGVRMTRMGLRQAEEMLRVLNGPGEADMLALGP
ncbi:hypothetical protein [Aureimonas altamirensis]|uniref:hypothetical protein n=1 Tax=Aureimonas altamirensis TaxID=370622 RepID=UPI00301825D1